MEDTPSSSNVLLTPGYLVRERWEILKKIGGGGFGEIYKAKDHHSGQACAVKVESCNSSKQVLKMEVAVLKRLQGITPHVCEFLGCGRNDKVNYVVMTLLGPSLSELRKRQPHQRFSISTVLRIGSQIIAAVRSIHNCGFLHRDIKPSNFAIGNTQETSRICYMLDFGLARQYTTLTGEVRQPRPVAGFRGTVRYASVNAHQAKDLGRHDDLWSVFYMLIELAVGHLPWRRIREKEEAGEFKVKYDHKKLIRGMPVEFQAFLDHLRSLSYSQKPDYGLVIKLLSSAVKRLGIQDSDPYDWEQDFSAPSLTTASVGSPPAVKLEKIGLENSAKNLKAKKTDESTSKTNCSGVGDLSENGEMKIIPTKQITEPDEQVQQLPYTNDNHPCDKLSDSPKNKHEASESDASAHGPVVQDGTVDVKRETSEIKSVSIDLNKGREKLSEGVDVDEVIQIENKYSSEESNNTSSSSSGSGKLPDNEGIPGLLLRYVPNTDAGKVAGRITPMKSIHTESLDRFFETGVQNVSYDSMRNGSPHFNPSSEKDNESEKSEPVIKTSLNEILSHEPVFESSSSSNEKVSPVFQTSQVSVQPDVAAGSHENLIAIIHPEHTHMYEPMQAYHTDQDVYSHDGHQTKPQVIDSNASVVIEQTTKYNTSLAQTQDVHSTANNPLRTSALRESDSSASVKMATVHFTPSSLTRNTDVHKKINSQSQNRNSLHKVDEDMPGSSTNRDILFNKSGLKASKRTLGQPRKLPSTPLHETTCSADAILPSSSNTTTLQAPHKTVGPEIRPNSIQFIHGTCSSSTETPVILSNGNPISHSYHSVLTPQPPSKPPPITYSSSISARRKRFLRPHVIIAQHK